MKKKLIACIIATTILAGCGPKELSSEQKKQVENLKGELSETKKEIADATQIQSQYAGGLIKDLTTARLEVLGTNKALLEQRIYAIEAGSKIDVAISSVKPNPESATAIKTEIDRLNIQVGEAKKEAGQYSGGLIQALKLSAIATQEQTLALLQQRYLIATYGLAEVNMPNGQANTSVPSKAAEQHTQAPLIPPGEGPFGLEVGLTKKNIEDMTGIELKPVADSPELYSATSLPKQNGDFELYGLVISPKAGLCEIRAVGKSIDTDSYGIALKTKYNELNDSLNSIYGDSKKTDFLLSGSIWKEPQDWMMSLLKGERYLTAAWGDSKQSPLKNNLQAVNVEARANSSDKGYVYLQYTFNNKNVCIQEIKAAKQSAL